MIKANKFFLPINVWKNLSKDAKNDIKEIFLQKTHNPYDCFFNQQSKIKCKVKEAAEAKGNKGISACYGCARCESVNKAMSKSNKYILFERFNRQANFKLKNILENEGYEVKIESRTVFPKLDSPWRIDLEKMDVSRAKEQKRLAELWLSEKNGILVCPPRFGKSILTAFIASELKTKVLILVHKVELARQFYTDYCRFTNIKESRIAINPDIESLKELDVVICTYQQFIRKNGPKRIKKARKYFGLVIVDEIHKAASTMFHKVINSFYARYKLGVTATPKRRDAKEFLNEFTFGPVLAKGGTEQLSCDYAIVETNWQGIEPKNNRGWESLWNKLATDEQRNQFIADCVIKDVKNGHRVMLPVKRHKQMELLLKLIKKAAKKNEILLKICTYHGKLNKSYRKELQKDVKDGKYDVVIGSDQILSLGFNAPPMSCIYINLHTYRTFEEDLYQEFSRVRTAYKKKNKPLIRIFHDISQASDKSIDIIEKIMIKYKFNRVEDSIVKNSQPKRSKKGLRILF